MDIGEEDMEGSERERELEGMMKICQIWEKKGLPESIGDRV